MACEQKSRDIRKSLEAFRAKDYKMKLLLAKKLKQKFNVIVKIQLGIVIEQEVVSIFKTL